MAMHREREIYIYVYVYIYIYLYIYISISTYTHVEQETCSFPACGHRFAMVCTCTVAMEPAHDR